MASASADVAGRSGSPAGRRTPRPGGASRRGPAGEGQQQDAARVDALGDQPGHAVDQRGGLARAGPGDDQQRPVAVLGGLALLGIEPGEDGLDARGAAHGWWPSVVWRSQRPDFLPKPGRFPWIIPRLPWIGKGLADGTGAGRTAGAVGRPSRPSMSTGKGVPCCRRPGKAVLQASSGLPTDSEIPFSGHEYMDKPVSSATLKATLLPRASSVPPWIAPLHHPTSGTVTL